MTDPVRPERRVLPVGSISTHAAGWWAIITIMLSEGALFAYLQFSYYYLTVQSHRGPWPPGGQPSLDLSLPNTIILILSSVAVWFGERGIKRGGQLRLMGGLVIGFALGALFVYIQSLEWQSKDFSIVSNAYGSLFFTVTGFHMAHLVVGLLVLLPLIVWSALGYFDAGRHAAISIGAIYWHFVDAVWITVFFTFYITPYLS